MTAEIVVLNREAVAMAADSAVTIGGGPKILNTANKVFMLAPNHSVGILLYNNPSLMNVPWEIIIKAYRDYIVSNEIVLADLEDYSKGFLRYVEENGSKFVTDIQEFGFFREMIFFEYGEMLRAIWNQIRNIFYEKAEISDDEINEIATNVVEENHNDWLKWEEILPEDQANNFRSKILSKFGELLSDVIKEGFGNFELEEDSFNKLKEIAVMKFSKEERKSGYVPPYTGIVFAGYGKENLFPVCVSYEVYSYLCETLVFIEEDQCRIGFSKEENSSAILPFGQDDVVRNILDGRLPYYELGIRHELSDKLKKEEIDDILKKVRDEIWNIHTQPVLDTIDVLPKDELASVARTLVNLTSFMRRVSSDIETVGGPVDVAVISKKDGFVWIDRKHYFEIDKNLHFSNRK